MVLGDKLVDGKWVFWSGFTVWAGNGLVQGDKCVVSGGLVWYWASKWVV